MRLGTDLKIQDQFLTDLDLEAVFNTIGPADVFNRCVVFSGQTIECITILYDIMRLHDLRNRTMGHFWHRWFGFCSLIEKHFFQGQGHR